MAPLRVAIIGGGPGGLVSARELCREGHSVTVYEAASQLGGVWVYTDETDSELIGRDPEVMAFSDFPFDDSFPGSHDSRRFPEHTEVLAYLRAFAAANNVEPLIRLSSPVTRVSRMDDAAEGPIGKRWLVRSRAAFRDGCSGEDAAEYDAVVVSAGHNAEPRLPDYPGEADFPGFIMHSHNYRQPEPFRGKTVVVVGASLSGTDLAQQIAEVADRVVLSSRNPRLLELLSQDERFQEAKRDREATAQLCPPPTSLPLDVQFLPDVAHLEADGRVVFTDGTTLDDVDAIVYCTGYRYTFPFLPPGILTAQDNHVRPLFGQVFPPDHLPSLSLIGVPWLCTPIPLMELQARWVARTLSGRVAAPSREDMAAEMLAETEARRALGFPDRYAHRLGKEFQQEYYDWLADRAGCARTPQWFFDLYQACKDTLAQDRWGFRDAPLVDPEDAAGRARAAWASLGGERIDGTA
ncbi:flavin-containing monooxygenase [Helicosporidium sp. ATCC 50920]|nr:flavin-containing monooxygenase [Helicosporidium sp. ATCC 50920]|eukprot:KDD74985.1 flavin-containing monooxygenase [Helicosporidium sp. ATCC 50920]